MNQIPLTTIATFSIELIAEISSSKTSRSFAAKKAKVAQRKIEKFETPLASLYPVASRSKEAYLDPSELLPLSLPPPLYLLSMKTRSESRMRILPDLTMCVRCKPVRFCPRCSKGFIKTNLHISHSSYYAYLCEHCEYEHCEYELRWYLSLLKCFRCTNGLFWHLILSNIIC